MKILIANWSWYPTGGDWTYIENIKYLYKRNGIEVIPFSIRNENNLPSVYNENFFEAHDFKKLNSKKTLRNGFRAVNSSIVSRNALNTLDRILEQHEIAIAHLHNIHHYLTPAIIWKLKKKNIKIIWSLHDYKIICPENSFVSNGKICERCISGNFYHCAINKCKKNSFSASLLATIEAYYYHSRSIYKKVDAYLCPSKYLYTKFVEFGFDKSKLVVSNLCYNINAVDSAIESYNLRQSLKKTKRNVNDRYILFVGRIEYIKGVKTLVEAVAETNLNLKIAGTGTALEELKMYSNLKGFGNIKFLGFQEKDAIYELIHHADFVVCPSEWYENFPFSVIESLLFSKAVIGARIGGIPELVLDGKTGYLFESGNTNDLREKILKLWNDNNSIIQFGQNAREHAKNLVSFETHWSILRSVINKLQIK